jgi:hypothetical protein
MEDPKPLLKGVDVDRYIHTVCTYMYTYLSYSSYIERTKEMSWVHGRTGFVNYVKKKKKKKNELIITYEYTYSMYLQINWHTGIVVIPSMVCWPQESGRWLMWRGIIFYCTYYILIVLDDSQYSIINFIYRYLWYV